NGIEYRTILRTMKTGYLPTTVFKLDVDGKLMNAIVKEIQYHPTTYQELHIDFQELIDDQYIEVNVPVRCIGIEDCVGVKLGGFLREVSRHVKVRCLPKDMPKEFCLDITKLNIGQSRRVKDLNISEEVRSIKSLEDVVMVIAKR
ncbi:MAG: 50S ribosomal protein L25, partial [Simkaniaceae bacterium]|nr:50S ribosomal protein L25 [Simkaniaceae bacterium]